MVPVASQTVRTKTKVSWQYFISLCVYVGLIIILTSAMLLTVVMVGTHGSFQYSGGQGPLRKALEQALNHHPPL